MARGTSFPLGCPRGHRDLGMSSDFFKSAQLGSGRPRTRTQGPVSLGKMYMQAHCCRKPILEEILPVIESHTHEKSTVMNDFHSMSQFQRMSPLSSVFLQLAKSEGHSPAAREARPGQLQSRLRKLGGPHLSWCGPGDSGSLGFLVNPEPAVIPWLPSL